MVVPDITPDDHMAAWLSALCFAANLALVGYALFRMVSNMLREWRRARLTRSVQTTELREGGHFVAGVVELEEGEAFAAQIEITQVGSNHTNGKGARSHRWKETSRRVISRPFWIRHASGERVFVEAARDVHLVDRLDKTVRNQTYLRYRIAELSEGEEVVAEGRLERRVDPRSQGGYRGADETMWVLLPRDEQALHLSAETLCARHRRRMWRMVRAIVLGWVPLAGLVALCMLGYVSRIVQGEHETVMVLGKRHYTTRGSKGQITHHYVVDCRRHEEEVDVSDWTELEPGQELPIIFAGPFTALGRHSTLHFMAGVCGLLLGLAMLGVYGAARKKEWWEGRYDEGGSGHLKVIEEGHSPRRGLAD